MKKITSIFLIIILIAIMLVSCDNNNEEESSINNSSENTSENSTDVSDSENINIEKYNGKELIVATTWNKEYMSEITFNDLQSEDNEFMSQAVNEAILQRNELAENLLDIRITEKKMVSDRKNGEFLSQIRNIYLTGSDNAHIIVPSLYDLGSLAASAELYDLNSLSKIDVTNNWWDQKFNEAITLNSKLFFTIGDIGIYNKNATPIVIFNKKLASIHINEDLYELVNQGKWTFDKAHEYAKLFSEDLDQNGTIDYYDNVGWAGQNDDAWNFYYSSGEKIVSADVDGNFRLSMNNKRSVDVIDKMNEMFHDEKYYISANKYFNAPYSLATPSIDGTGQAFIAGRIMFFSDNMNFVHRFSVMEDDFGILPVPKYDIEQESYNSLINPWTGNAFAIPVSLTEEEANFAANCLDIMGYYSTDTIAKEYIERTLKYQKTRDEGSIEMLNIILNSRGCDFGIIYDIGSGTQGASLPFMLHTLLSNPTVNFTSLYETFADAAQNDLDKIIDFYNE